MSEAVDWSTGCCGSMQSVVNGKQEDPSQIAAVQISQTEYIQG